MLLEFEACVLGGRVGLAGPVIIEFCFIILYVFYSSTSAVLVSLLLSLRLVCLRDR